MVGVKWVPPERQQLEGSFLSEKLILCFLGPPICWSSGNLLVGIAFLGGPQNQKFPCEIGILILRKEGTKKKSCHCRV